MSEVISSFRSLRAGSQVFALLMLFFLSDFAYYGMFCLSANSMMSVKILLAVCMLVAMVVCAKADSVSSVNCVQSDFL